MKLLAEVLSAVKPSRKELNEELKIAGMLLRKIKKSVSSSCEVVLTGSVAKKTFLRDGRDIDIFVLFGKTVSKKSFESRIKKIMARAFPSVGYQVSYAEHPYARFHYHGRKVDLVPAYKISKATERLSAVDRSVLHTRFVRKSLKAKQTDEVLLLKQFLKANSLYGAEIKTKGFSGYLCELLIIRHKTFRKLVREASKWKDVFIDLKRFYTQKEKEGAKKRFGSRFIVIDPTDKDRNVAAAVSEKNFKAFITLCKRFIRRPAKELFFRLPETFEQKVKRAARGSKAITVSMPRPEVVDDVLWGQLHKLMNQLKDHLGDFGPKDIIADDSRHIVRLAVILKKDRLPSKMLISGPPMDMKKHVVNFRKSHRRTRFVKKRKRLYAEVKRPVTKAETAVLQFFRKYSQTKSHLAYPEEMLIIEKR